MAIEDGHPIDALDVRPDATLTPDGTASRMVIEGRDTRLFELEISDPDVFTNLITAHLSQAFPTATSFTYEREHPIGWGESVPEHLKPHRGEIIKDSVVVIGDQNMAFEVKRGNDRATQGLILRDEGMLYMDGQAGGGLTPKRLETSRDGKVAIDFTERGIGKMGTRARVSIVGENPGIGIVAVSSFLAGLRAGQEIPR